MREITITKSIFRFDELSDKAKVKAIQKYYDIIGYVWADEALMSLKKLAEHFNGKLKDWQVDWCGFGKASFEMPTGELSDHEIAQRVKGLGNFDSKTLKGHGQCKLTGFCCDESAIDGLRVAFYDGERDLNLLMQAAFFTWHKACVEGFADMQSVDQFSEKSEGNDYEFLADGSLYHEERTESKNC